MTRDTQEFATGDWRAVHKIAIQNFYHFQNQLKPKTTFQFFNLFFPSEFLKHNVLFIINLKIEGKPVS